jgi:hypothetical protein
MTILDLSTVQVTHRIWILRKNGMNLDETGV